MALVLIQLPLPTTFPNGTASQDAAAASAETRRELAETLMGWPPGRAIGKPTLRHT